MIKTLVHLPSERKSINVFLLTLRSLAVIHLHELKQNKISDQRNLSQGVDAYLMAARYGSMTLRKGLVIKISNPLGVRCQLGPPLLCFYCFWNKGTSLLPASIDEVSTATSGLAFLACRHKMEGELVCGGIGGGGSASSSSPQPATSFSAQSGTGFITSTELRSWLVTFGFLSRDCFSSSFLCISWHLCISAPSCSPWQRGHGNSSFPLPGNSWNLAGWGPSFIAWAFHQLWVLSLSFYLLHSFLCGLAGATENSGLCLVDRWSRVCRLRVDSQAGFLATPEARNLSLKVGKFSNRRVQL